MPNRKSNQTKLQTWFIRLLLVVVTINVATIKFFHVVLDHEEQLSSVWSSDVESSSSGHHRRSDNNKRSKGENMNGKIVEIWNTAFDNEEDGEPATERQSTFIEDDIDIINNDVNNDGHVINMVDTTIGEKDNDCIHVHDTILDDSDTLHNQEKGRLKSNDNALRIIPHKVHIILPPHSSKNCVSKEIHSKIQKWHLANHSIYIHDQNSIREILSSLAGVVEGEDNRQFKYKNNYLSQFYHGSTLFQDQSWKKKSDHQSNGETIYDPSLIQYPCGSTVSKWWSDNNNTTTNNNNNKMIGHHPHELFLNDFAKLLVLWEYGGLVISNITSYEPSDFLLQALKEEQDVTQLLQSHRFQSQPHHQRQKKLKDIQQIALFTTNTTQFIIETNEQFEYNQEFFASIPHHPLIHHILSKTIQRYQKYLYNTTTSSSWDQTQIMTSYHDYEYWNKDVYKFMTTKFYTHKFRRPTQISPPNVNRWNYLFEIFEKMKDRDVPTITILDRDKFNGQSLLKEVKSTIQVSTSFSSLKKLSSSMSSPPSCVNYFEPCQTNLTSLLEIVAPSSSSSTVSSFRGNHETSSCPKQLQYVQSKLDPIYETIKKKDMTTTTGRQYSAKIPPIIHMTGKTKCLTKIFYDSIQKWYDIPNHAVLYHDDEAVERLLDSQEWDLFPQLKQAIKCVSSGAGLADLWRYLLMWEYGGIYTDLDNAPGPDFVVNTENGATIIRDDMDAVFEVEKGGFPSQYFFAVSPHHPVMYFAIQNSIDRLLDVNDIHTQKVPFVTGPGALKAAVVDTIGGTGYPEAGEHKGMQNRNISIIGSRLHAHKKKFIDRRCVSNENDEHFFLMNMTRYESLLKEAGRQVNCLGIIHESYLKDKSPSNL